MIILHLYMRVSYIQYTTCNKIMEGKKKDCCWRSNPFSWFVCRSSFVEDSHKYWIRLFTGFRRAADYGGPYIDERPTMNDFLRFIK